MIPITKSFYTQITSRAHRLPTLAYEAPYISAGVSSISILFIMFVSSFGGQDLFGMALALKRCL